ncbi:MAG: hypothetical protein GF350_04795 [Chitinivibrionales bacterium]|nr:hypothetical protein [Chitinivibrionales bacterium]
MAKKKKTTPVRITGTTGDYKVKSGKRVVSTHNKKSAAKRAKSALLARRKKRK